VAGSRVRVKLESGVRLRDARPVRSGVFLSGLYACWEVYRYSYTLEAVRQFGLTRKRVKVPPPAPRWLPCPSVLLGCPSSSKGAKETG